MSMLRVVKAVRYPNGEDLRDSSALPGTGPQYLSSLTNRPGGHPLLKPRILPQRQFPEPIESEAREVLFGLMKQLHSEYPGILCLGLSKAGGGAADAIYARRESPTCNHEAAKVGYEIAHAHPADNSLHMLLSPADAGVVIKARWGRRFATPSTVPPGWVSFAQCWHDGVEVEISDTEDEGGGSGVLTDVDSGLADGLNDDDATITAAPISGA
ncbi:unnamed protein product [Penicillium palitans]